MTNSRRKGNKSERWVKQAYENAGYTVFKPDETQFGQTDMFGLYDLLALPEHTEHTTPRGIQVKSNTASGVQNWMREVTTRFSELEWESDFVIRHDGHGGPHPTPPQARVLRPTPTSNQTYETVVDERPDGRPKDGAGIEQWLEHERPKP